MRFPTECITSSSESKNELRIVILALGVVALVFSPLLAQNNSLPTIGIPPSTSAVPVENGVMELSNGGLNLAFELASPPERGAWNVHWRLVYQSRIWFVFDDGTGNLQWKPVSTQGGWSFQNGPANNFDWNLATHLCATDNTIYYTVNRITHVAGDSQHAFDITPSLSTASACSTSVSSGNAYATDASGYHISASNFFPGQGTLATIIAPDGTVVLQSNGSAHDANGNIFGVAPPNSASIDTLGRQVVLPSAGTNQTFYDIWNSQTQRSRVTVNTASITATPTFGQPGVTEQPQTITVVTSIALPDGTSYQFTYDSYGELATMTLPTGAQVGYGYSNFHDAYGVTNRWLSSRTVGNNQWVYTPSIVGACAVSPLGYNGPVDCAVQVRYQKPSGDFSTYNFQPNGGNWLTGISAHNALGTSLAGTSKNYDFSHTCSSCGNAAAFVLPIIEVDSILGAGSTLLSRQRQYTYDSYQTGNPTVIKEWSFYTGTPPAQPDRETDIAYLNSPAYISNNIINRPTTVTVKNGAGTQVSQTVTSYDTTALTLISGIYNHDDTNYGVGNTVRGNSTQIQRWISGSSFLSTTLNYDTTGQVVQSTDSKGNSTSYSYADRFYSDNGTGVPATLAYSATTNAYLTGITLPGMPQVTMGYYWGTGQSAITTDLNSNVSYSHYAEPFSRFTQSKDAVGGWLLASYTSATQQELYQSLTDTVPSSTCTSCAHQRTLTDNLGRLTRSTLVSDPDGQSMTDFAYDVNGRVQTTTNPYRSTLDSTYGVTTPAYDALDRTTKITRPGGTFSSISYGPDAGSVAQTCGGATGYPILIADEAGKKRLYWRDGFDRLVEVDEPDGGGGFTIATCYQYDALNNLVSVTQRGGTTNSAQWRSRTFSYDGLSRLSAVTTPEAGTVNYFYTTAGGAVCSGDPQALCRRTDARGITTTYSYDALNRLTAKSYSDTTPAVTYFYDQTTYNGLTISNGKGRRTGMSDGSGQSAWSYDAAGRVLTKRQTVLGITKSASYTYNLDGSVASVTYPSGRVFTYSYNTALQPVSVTDTTDGYKYVSQAHYAAPGMLISNYHGETPTAIAITKNLSYNNRLELTQIRAANPVPATLLDYGFTYNQPGGNNGNVVQVNNNVDSTRSVAYTYDQLNRLSTAGTYNSLQWGNAYVYDNWGNLLQKNPTQGTNYESLAVAVDVHNHIVGDTYDAAGNTTWDQSVNMRYDAENRGQTATGSYAYDGDDHRVKKTDGTLFWYDESFSVLAVGNTTGAINTEYVYFNGERIGILDVAAGGDPYYYVADHLGSVRIMTSGGGRIVYADNDFYPWGRELTLDTSVDFKFTGYWYDYDIGYNFAGMRYQSFALGRFLTPDLLFGDPTNPQSWNRYSYVLNNPTTLVDPLGLRDCLRPDGTVQHNCPEPPPGDEPSEPHPPSDVGPPATQCRLVFGGAGMVLGTVCDGVFFPGALPTDVHRTHHPGDDANNAAVSPPGALSQAINSSIERLGVSRCSEIFGGASGAIQAQAVLRATTYTFGLLPDPSSGKPADPTVGAATTGPLAVTINTVGPWFLGPGARPVGVSLPMSRQTLRSFMLMHELIHQMNLPNFRQNDSLIRAQKYNNNKIFQNCF